RPIVPAADAGNKALDLVAIDAHVGQHPVVQQGQFAAGDVAHMPGAKQPGQAFKHVVSPQPRGANNPVSTADGLALHFWMYSFALRAVRSARWSNYSVFEGLRAIVGNAMVFASLISGVPLGRSLALS